MHNQKIKLAILLSKYGGEVVTSVNDPFLRLDKDRFDVAFVYLSGDPASDNHLEKAGYKVCRLSSVKHIKIFQPIVLFKLIRFLRKNQIDLLHCHAHKAIQYGAIAGVFLPRLKIIAHVHGLGRSARLRRKSANFLFLGRIDRFLTVAKAVREDLIQSNWRIPASKVTVLENSVDYEKFANVNIARSQVCGMMDLSEDAFVFGTIGRLAKTKGLSYLIEAFARVYQKHPNARLLLVGEGPEEPVCRELATSLNIRDAVCFAGYRKEVEKIYRLIDVLVLSSIAEGMPRVILEAMAAGIPCIGTNVGGIPELVDACIGRVVETQDSSALAQAMTEFIEKTPEQLKAMSDAVARKAKTRYSHTVVTEKLTRIYYDVLGRTELSQ